MFQYAQEAWSTIDINEPDISNYSIKEILKLIATVFILGFSIFILVGKLEPQLLLFLINTLIPGCVILFLVVRTPNYIANTLNVMKGNRFSTLDRKKARKEVTKNSIRFLIIVLFYGSIITGTQLLCFYEKNFIFYLISYFVTFVTVCCYLFSSPLILFSQSSLTQAIGRSISSVFIKFFTIIQILFLDLLPGLFVMLLREVSRRYSRPSTLLSFNSILRFYPYLILSIGILYREVMGLTDIIDLSVPVETEKAPQDDGLHLGNEELY
ncbi:hypothetical protein ACD661_15080 [Legionella lytica]|uniref:Uncharacterized protein n=1 Tax=Legionella lytica TaxID=96232 RepID=A0ABW8DB02_9GAMM